jgi:hypothetical protein
VRPGQVVDEGPPQPHQGRPHLYQSPVPVTISTRRRPPPYQATSRVCGGLVSPDDLGGAGQVLPLDPRTSLARLLRRRLDRVGIGVEQADQGQPPRGLCGEFGELVLGACLDHPPGAGRFRVPPSPAFVMSQWTNERPAWLEVRRSPSVSCSSVSRALTLR